MKISVVIPCFNGAQYLSQALDSIEAQTLPPDEVILIDDGSTDASVAIAKEYTGVRVVSNSKNMGIGYTRQKGLWEATGTHVAFLSTDDVWATDFLKWSVWGLTRAEATYTDYFRVGPDLKVSSIFEAPEWSKKEAIAWALRKNMFVNFSTVVFPRDIDIRFQTDMRHGEDIIFLLDTLAIDLDWGRINEPLVSYRVHPTMGSKTQTRAEFDLTWRNIQLSLRDLGVDNQVILDAYKTSRHRTYGLIPRMRKGIRKLIY